MPGTPLQRALYACTVTVTGPAQSLLALIQGLGGNYANCPGSSRSWNIQADQSNGDNVLIGDENVAISPQQCFYNAGAAFTFLDRASIPGMCPIGSVYVIAVTGTQLLNVAVFGD